MGSPSEQNEATSTTPPDESLDSLGLALNACLLKEFKFALAGGVLGTGIGVYKRSLMPLVIAGGVGSIADLIYGIGFSLFFVYFSRDVRFCYS